MGETMIEELKRRIVAEMMRTRRYAQDAFASGLERIAHQERARYYGLDWVLDTIAELEIKNETADR